MFHYKLRTKEHVVESGCPRQYMDANFHWKTLFVCLKFDAEVNSTYWLVQLLFLHDTSYYFISTIYQYHRGPIH
jgi:hypothetical protein